MTDPFTPRTPSNPFLLSPTLIPLSIPSASSSRIPSLSDAYSQPNIPPELLYHIAEHASPSTLSALCLVSYFFRAIASPQLYKSMTIEKPSQLRPFLPDPVRPSSHAVDKVHFSTQTDISVHSCPSQSSPLAPFNPSLTLDKVVSLDLTIHFGFMPPEDCNESTYQPLQFPSLLHLTLQCEWFDMDEDLPPYFPLFAAAQILLPLLNPQTLVISGNLWNEEEMPTVVWNSFVPRWSRLSSVRFVNCSLVSPACADDDVDVRPVFFPSIQSASISFSWHWEHVEYGYEALCWRGDGILPSLERSGLFAHPSVQARGIEFDVGARKEDVAALVKDIARLEERNRSLVRSRLFPKQALTVAQ
jgi:hypothetical protein